MENEVVLLLKQILAENQEIRKEISNVQNEISDVKKEVQKNSIRIEELSKKIDIVAEVQVSHKEQNERQFEGLKEEMHERFDILETATRNISKDLMDVQDEVKALAEISGRHEMDIMVLKRRPV